MIHAQKSNKVSNVGGVCNPDSSELRFPIFVGGVCNPDSSELRFPTLDRRWLFF